MTESHDSQTGSGINSHSVAAMDAVAKPSHSARRHKPSASLGSLYEVLADLDDNQLQYLIQEMNHTGHQNVPVSQAVSTFEALKSTSSAEPFAVSETGFDAPAPDSPAREPLRHLSKSRRGRLSLQTAFQRAPSLRQRHRQQQQQQQPSLDSPRDDYYLNRSSTFSQGPEPAQSHRPAKGYCELLSSPVSSCSSPAGGPVIMSGLPEPATVTRSPRYDETAVPQSASQPLPSPPPSTSHLHHQLPPPPPSQPQLQPRRPSTNGVRMGPPAYHRISRPDFNLPDGVTVTDLLHLLEIEYMSSNRQPSSSSRRSSSSSTSSSVSRPSFSSPSPSSPALATRLFPPPSRSFSQTPNLHGRSPLRRSSSRLDLALGAERSASGAAEVGMGMLEPRQVRSVSLGFPGGGMATSMSMDSLSRSLKGESRPPAPAPVFEGIFDVLENQ